MLKFPNIAMKDFSCQIRHFHYRVHFWNVFEKKKLPAIHQGSERKRQVIGVFAIMIGEFDVVKRQGWLP